MFVELFFLKNNFFVINILKANPFFHFMRFFCCYTTHCNVELHSFALIKLVKHIFSRTWFRYFLLSSCIWKISFWEFNFAFLTFFHPFVQCFERRILSLFCIYRWGNYYHRLKSLCAAFSAETFLFFNNWLYDFSMIELLFVCCRSELCWTFIKLFMRYLEWFFKGW